MTAIKSGQSENLHATSSELGRFEIAEFFHTKRLASGLSLETVAEGLGVTNTQVIADYETGKAAIPLDDIFALTNLLNVAPEDVMALMFQVSKTADR